MPSRMHSGDDAKTSLLGGDGAGDEEEISADFLFFLVGSDEPPVETTHFDCLVTVFGVEGA